MLLHVKYRIERMQLCRRLLTTTSRSCFVPTAKDYVRRCSRHVSLVKSFGVPENNWRCFSSNRRPSNAVWQGRPKLVVEGTTHELFSDKPQDVTIDTRGLFGVGDNRFVPHPSKPLPTSLAIELALYIKMRGPLTAADYMQQALQHPRYGYYTRASTKIGRAGDFVTAPEISQLFGELLGVWCRATWESMGKPTAVHLIEVGPGRGTLMVDLLRAADCFPDFAEALQVHLIESSPTFRREQAKALGATVIPPLTSPQNTNTTAHEFVCEGKNGRVIRWHSSLADVPPGPTLLIGQELLDALPVHQFQFTEEDGWCERMVDVDEGPEGHHLKFVLSTGKTPAVLQFMEPEELTESSLGATEGSVVSANEKINEVMVDVKEVDGPAVGDIVEVCPAAISIVNQAAKRIAEHGGGALFIDYGNEHVVGDSMRAFKGHKEVHVFAEPGMADITADVDFGTLKKCVQGVKGARCYGPIQQGQFLYSMGAVERLDMLLDAPNMTEERADALVQGVERLMDPEQMGARYKVMGIMDDRQQAPPPGFPPDV